MAESIVILNGEQVTGDVADKVVKEFADRRSKLMKAAQKAGYTMQQLEGVTYDPKTGKFGTIPNYTGD